MALAYLYDPLKQWQDLRGVNNVAGWLEVFISGTDEHAVAYSDFNGTLLPERIPIDNDGRAVVIVDSEKAYRVEVHDASGALRFTQYPVWTQVSGGGVIGSFVELESSNGSVDIVKTTVGSTTTYDIAVAQDSTDLLDWISCSGYTSDSGKMIPSYSSGTMEVDYPRGIRLVGGRYYHVTANYTAVTQSAPIYNEFEIRFLCTDGNGTTVAVNSKRDIVDCSTELHQDYSFSFDVMPSADCFMAVEVTGVAEGVSVGLLDMQVHRVFSGAPQLPAGIATREWVSGNFQPTLSVGDGLELSGSFLSVDYSDVQEKLTAGDNITIENNVISATVPEYADADWDASSGEPGYIHNKPDMNDYQPAFTTQRPIDMSGENVLGMFYGDGLKLDYRSSDHQLALMIDASEVANEVFPPFTPATDEGKVLTVGQSTPYWAEIPEQVNADWDATSGISQILNRPDMVSLVAGENITITKEGSTLTISGEAGGGADWDAASGEPGYIHNKPEIPPDNVFIATYGSTTYQELSAAHTAGKAIFVTNVSGALSAVIPMTSFSVNPAMVMFSSVIGSSEYRAKIDQGVWSSTTVSMQADWDEASQLSPAYIANKPTIVTPVNADWDATSGLSEILHKPDLSIYAQSADLATVATTGSYNSLTDKPTIPAAQVNADWDATSGIAQILNRPEETTLVAGENVTITESGSTITISAQGGGAEQVNADWDATSGVSEILHKPDLSIYAQSADLATVATTGSYNSLTDLPTIPAAQVQTDWDATSGMGQLLNRPDLVDIVAGPGIVVDNPDGNTLRVSMAADYEEALYTAATDDGTTLSVNGYITLSESLTHFEKVKIYFALQPSWGGKLSSEIYKVSGDQRIVLEQLWYREQSGYNNYWQTITFSKYDDANLKITLIDGSQRPLLNTAWGTTGLTLTIYKVVGINRISGGN